MHCISNSDFSFKLEAHIPGKYPWVFGRGWPAVFFFFRWIFPNTLKSTSPKRSLPSPRLSSGHSASQPLCFGQHHPLRVATTLGLLYQGVCVSRFAQDSSACAYCPGKITDSPPFMLRTALDWIVSYTAILALFASDSCSVHDQVAQLSLHSSLCSFCIAWRWSPSSAWITTGS